MSRLLILPLLASALLASSPTFEHELDWSRAPEGALQVTLHVGGCDTFGSAFIVRMPNWTPGAYRFRGFGERVTDLRARAGSVDGAELTVTRDGTDTWLVDHEGAATVVFQYTVPLGGRRSNLAQGVHITGPETYLYLPGYERVGAHRVHMVGIPEGWQLTTGLVRHDDGSYSAVDYDQLIDCPVTVGPLLLDEIVVKGCPIELSYQGDRALAERMNAELKEEIGKICAWQFDFFGEIPFDRYVFQFTVGGGRGASGLEHHNSTEIYLSEGSVFSSTSGLSVIAHEFFHLWNVKRIRSETINPFDYTEVPRMDSLWFLEGVTDYYTAVCLLHTGVYTPEQYLNVLGRAWSQCNQTDDYYTRGRAWGFALDLEIRAATGNRRSLDDVMRYMNWQFARPDRGFERSEGIFHIIDAVAQADLSSRWLPIVLGEADADFSAIAPVGGLSFKLREISRSAFFGVQAEPSAAGGIVLGNVVPGSSAADAGFAVGDRLLSLNGTAFTEANWGDLIRGTEPGAEVVIVRVRGDEEREVRFAMGYRAQTEGRLARDPEASAEARAVFEGFLAAEPFRAVPDPGEPAAPVVEDYF